MNDQTTAIEKSPITMGKGGLQLETINDAYRFAQYVIASGLAPRSFQKPEAIIVAIQHGAEVGFTPMQSLQSIAVINGKPSIFGDGIMALLRASEKLDSISETIEGDDDKMCAVCITKRKGMNEPSETRFSVADAKRAGLWGKTGPWTQYPQRMLQMRARSWNVRDNFADVLAGIHVAEEVLDYSPGGRRVDAEATKQNVIDVNASIGVTVDDEPEVIEVEDVEETPTNEISDDEKARIEADEAAGDDDGPLY